MKTSVNTIRTSQRAAELVAVKVSNSPAKEEALLNFIEAQKFSYATKSIPSILTKEQGQQYIEWLSSKTSFDDLVHLFKKDNFQQLFGANTRKILSKILSDILHTNDSHISSSREFFEKKLRLLRNILGIAVEEQNSDIGNIIINTIVNGNSSEDLTPVERRRLYVELKEILDGSGSLDGFTSMNVMGSLLASPFSNTLLFAMDRFSDEELVRNIFTRAYKEDYDSAQESARGIFHFLETRDLPNIHSAQIVRYGELVGRIKKINTEAATNSRSITSSLDLVQPLTIEVLSSRSNAGFTAAGCLTSKDSTALVISKPTQSLAKFLEDPTIQDSRIEIDTSKYLPSNKDIVEGLSMMIEVLPESSPLRHKLEDFLTQMPAYVTQFEPDIIKSQLIGLLKPIFPDRCFDMVNILGAEYPSLKKAYYAVESRFHKVFDWQDRQEIPNLKYYFDEYDADERGMDVESYYTRINLDMYKSGEKSLVDVAGIFCERYSRDTMPRHQYVKNFIDHYKKRIKQTDPKFDVNLESTHSYMGKVRKFMKFLGQTCIEEPSLRTAASLLNSACDKYMKLKLNDQTFLDEVIRLQRYCMEPHGSGPGVARDIDYLIDTFMKLNR